MQSEVDTLQDFRREFLWRFSKYLLHDRDLEWAGRHLPELRKMSIEPVFPLLRYIWSDLLMNAQHLAKVYPVLKPLSEAVMQYCRFHQDVNTSTLAAQDELLTALAAVDTWPLVIKGAAMRAYTSMPQAMNDLDIITRNLDETWEVVKVAEGLGYPLKKLKLRWASTHSSSSPFPYHGYANLYRLEGGGTYTQGDWDLGRVRTLDMHITRFYCLGEGVMLTDLWQRAFYRNLEETKVLVPCVEDMILIELMHLLRHGTLAIRGINRLCQLVADGESPDFDYLVAEIRRNDLSLIANAAFFAIERTFPHAQSRVTTLLSRLDPPPFYLRPIVSGLAKLDRVERYGAGNLTSTLLQTHYLYMSYRHQIKHHWPLMQAIIGFQRMFRHRKVYPRAHARWKERKLGWISKSNRAIMLVRLDRQIWQPENNWQTLQENSHVPPNSSLVSTTSLLASSGESTEVLLTPIGSFTTADYDGNLSEKEVNLCLKYAQTLRKGLS